MVPAQLDPATGGPLAYVGTYLVTVGFYAVTAHIAARYVLGAVPADRALVVGAALGIVSLLLQQYGPAPVIAVSLIVDLLVVAFAYRIAYRLAAIVTAVHFAVSAILGITVLNAVRLFATMPG